MPQINTAMKERPAAQEPKGWTHGTFYWNELMTHDVERAKRFYADTLGWRFEACPMDNMGEGMAGMTYWVAHAGNEMVGGLFDMGACSEMADIPENWLSHIAVDNVDKRYEKALAAGATPVRPPFDVPTVGRIAILKQPGGGVIGWMTPAA